MSSDVRSDQTATYWALFTNFVACSYRFSFHVLEFQSFTSHENLVAHKKATVLMLQRQKAPMLP